MASGLDTSTSDGAPGSKGMIMFVSSKRFMVTEASPQNFTV
jgi:hypothetical protein